jgi:hypothetical protein
MKYYLYWSLSQLCNALVWDEEVLLMCGGAVLLHPFGILLSLNGDENIEGSHSFRI